MAGKEEEEKAKLLAHLDGAVFDFYYDSFAKDGSLLESAKDYQRVKRKIIEHFTAN